MGPCFGRNPDWKFDIKEFSFRYLYIFDKKPLFQTLYLLSARYWFNCSALFSNVSATEFPILRYGCPPCTGYERQATLPYKEATDYLKKETSDSS